MSSIIRWQRGLVVATWGSCPERADVTITSSEALAQDPCRCSRTAGSFNTSVRPQQGKDFRWLPRNISVRSSPECIAT